MGSIGKSRTTLSRVADISADIDVSPNEAAVVAKAGVDQTVVVAMRASVVR